MSVEDISIDTDGFVLVVEEVGDQSEEEVQREEQVEELNETEEQVEENEGEGSIQPVTPIVSRKSRSNKRKRCDSGKSVSRQFREISSGITLTRKRRRIHFVLNKEHDELIS